MRNSIRRTLADEIVHCGTEAISSEPLSKPDVLNLGCGRKRMENAINLDRTAETAPDIVHDLNQTPWPFPHDSFRPFMLTTSSNILMMFFESWKKYTAYRRTALGFISRFRTFRAPTLSPIQRIGTTSDIQVSTISQRTMICLFTAVRDSGRGKWCSSSIRQYFQKLCGA